MRWVSYEQAGTVRVGRVVDGGVQPVAGRDMVAVIRGEGAEPDGDPIALGDVRLLAPIPRPANVICIALNYRDHAQESGMAIPQRPAWFSKFSNAVIGPGEAVRVPPLVEQVDYEAELTVAIGARTHNVSPEDALGHVFGYMNGNDVSARDLQRADAAGQFARGKSVDTFGPMGPELVTPDELPDPQSLAVRCTVNGELVQDGHTSGMVFSVAELIAAISATQTLVPGDVIMTGTPAGVILGRERPVWLEPGDEMTVEVQGLGRLTNRIEASQ